MNKITTLFFDLDGTLLPMDMEYFVTNYFKKLAPRFVPFLEPKQFIAHLWSATKAMLTNTNPEYANETVFWEHFTTLVPVPREVLEPLFDDFYHNEFKTLEPFTQPSPIVPEIIDLAHKQGFELVLATNPVFPSVATRERMRWAGIQEYPWKLVTTYENSRYCKPNPEYFQDILKAIGRVPTECLMIGNDMQEDMGASDLGLYTFLVTDGLIDKGSPQYTPTFQGSLTDLKTFFINRK
jgi:FMN phosphatase YigB (HAD superfamily)